MHSFELVVLVLNGNRHMALTLIHDKFKVLIDGITGGDAYPVFIPEEASFPAYMYSLETLSRDIESNLRDTTVSAHVFGVHVVDKTFAGCHDRTQKLLDGLDQYTEGSSGSLLLVLVEDAQDGFDPDLDAYTKTLVVSVRVKEI